MNVYLSNSGLGIYHNTPGQGDTGPNQSGEKLLLDPLCGCRSGSTGQDISCVTCENKMVKSNKSEL